MNTDISDTSDAASWVRGIAGGVRDLGIPDDDAALLDVVRELVQLRTITDHQLTVYATTAQTRGIARAQGVRTRKLLMGMGVAPAVAARYLRLGGVLDALGTVAGYFADGAISSEHVDAIHRGLEHIEKRSGEPVDAEQRRRYASDLAGQAFSKATPVEIVDYARRVGNRVAADTGGLPASEDRSINTVITEPQEGRLRVRADLDAVVGEKLSTLLDRYSAPRPQPDGSRDPRSTSRRLADGLETILDLAMCGANGDPDVVAMAPVQIAVTIPADTPDLASLPFLGVVTESTARLLSCDGTVTAMLVDGEQVPLQMGRTKRLFTAQQRKALAHRDKGCVKCGAPASWTHAHHLTHWSKNGSTDLDNGCLLCPACHDDVHHNGWQVVMGTDCHPWLIPPATVDPAHTPIASYHRRGLTLDNLRTAC